MRYTTNLSSVLYILYILYISYIIYNLIYIRLLYIFQIYTGVLLLDIFNLCSLFSSFKEINRLFLNFKTSSCNLKKSEVWKQKNEWLFYYFNFGRNYNVLKSKSPCFLLSKNINPNKNKTWIENGKSHKKLLERQTLRFSLYKKG